ncbi:unnamed protein product [Rotaria socialis]|uniref:Uncharacterized protein n=1 Tax=Rotaria socialis TaxID=392032 RepID=A0A818F161_9BILA|nr:unnamed protein product [Rotaria socialis]CAF4240969.1 unnamed protein product [Rotaria socialis]
MASTSDDISSCRNDEIDLISSRNKGADENEEIERTETPLSTTIDQKEKLFSTSNTIEPKRKSTSIKSSISISSSDDDEINKENLDRKRQYRLKSRSVSFAPMVEEFEIPSSRHSSFESSHQSIDFIDVLVESYKLQTANNLFSLKEEKKYIPKTARTRVNPNWREHRIRCLMNKLEVLSLSDREEELKVTQAQFLREQKLEQIQDRQRNHDLCLQLMRQRHESEIENAVLLDRSENSINDEITSTTIAQTMNLASQKNVLGYGLLIPPSILKRRVPQEHDNKLINLKTPIGRYRQFETTMNNKLEKINDNLQPDLQILRAYSSFHTSIPSTVVPLFSETYLGLLSVPNIYSSNRYKQYPYDVTHASSPDHEIRRRSHSTRDVRVPLKEQMNDNNKYASDDDYEYNQPRLNSILSVRSPNKNILESTTESSNGVSRKNRSTSVPTNKRVQFLRQDYDQEESFHSNKSSNMTFID